MQDHVDWVLIILGTQVIKKTRRTAPCFQTIFSFLMTMIYPSFPTLIIKMIEFCILQTVTSTLSKEFSWISKKLLFNSHVFQYVLVHCILWDLQSYVYVNDWALNPRSVSRIRRQSGFPQANLFVWANAFSFRTTKSSTICFSTKKSAIRVVIEV